MIYRRSASTREKSTKLGSRPPLVRSHSATHKARHPFQSHLALPIILNKVERKVSDAKRGERPPSILGSIFGMPKPHDAKPERQQVTRSFLFLEWVCLHYM